MPQSFRRRCKRPRADPHQLRDAALGRPLVRQYLPDQGRDVARRIDMQGGVRRRPARASRQHLAIDDDGVMLAVEFDRRSEIFLEPAQPFAIRTRQPDTDRIRRARKQRDLSQHHQRAQHMLVRFVKAAAEIAQDEIDMPWTLHDLKHGAELQGVDGVGGELQSRHQARRLGRGLAPNSKLVKLIGAGRFRPEQLFVGEANRFRLERKAFVARNPAFGIAKIGRRDSGPLKHRRRADVMPGQKARHMDQASASDGRNLRRRPPSHRLPAFYGTQRNSIVEMPTDTLSATSPDKDTGCSA